ncbi:MAG: DUF3619 family protein [Gallionella sp.]|nr:DUF3619 family protein [Gallionella sp.]MDD4960481.1 DUF3619 family protein [Gallionella sp.]
MNAELDPHRVVRLLTHHSSPLDNKTLISLAQARENAVRQKASPSYSWVLAGHVFSLPHRPRIEYQLLLVCVLAAALFIAIDAWQDDQDQQNADIDIAILTDELPLDVFIDSN